MIDYIYSLKRIFQQIKTGAHEVRVGGKGKWKSKGDELWGGAWVVLGCFLIILAAYWRL